ncbi:hypothetical protein RR48_01454 [Papilio machaon]|uniref:Uncharacterized protein n=1 Tax=Papilio machaon TaxID=76193 RepID=A0A0N1ICS0_PAPMA|nr:hypothetical protein RR48_01454 [Papilio machaon]
MRNDAPKRWLPLLNKSITISFLFRGNEYKYFGNENPRSNKYLQKSAITRVCAVGGFFISIPVFLTGIILYTFIQFHSTPAIVTSVFIGVGIIFCGCAMVHNVFVWQKEKTNLVKAFRGQDLNATNATSPNISTSNGALLGNGHLNTTGGNVSFHSVAGAPYTHPITLLQQGIILYTFIQFHSTPAIVTSVFIGVGIIFCGCAMVHNVFVWQKEKTNLVKAFRGQDLNATNATSPNISTSNGALLGNGHLNTTGGNVSFHSVAGAPYTHPITLLQQGGPYIIRPPTSTPPGEGAATPGVPAATIDLSHDAHELSTLV